MENKLNLEQVAKFPRPGMAGLPIKFGFTPDNQQVTFLQALDNSLVLQLWAYDIKSGMRHKLIEPPLASQNETTLSQDEKLRRERARLRETGVTSYQFASKTDQPVLLVPLAGKLYVRHGDGPLEELAKSDGAVDAKLSPNGKWVAFVRDNNLCVMLTTGGPVFDLTVLGDKDGKHTYGVAEYVAQEEMGRSEGFWWRPDSQALAYEAVYNDKVPELVIAHTSGDEPSTETHLYPFAGKANATVSLYTCQVNQAAIDTANASGLEVADALIDLTDQKDFYLTAVTWRPDNTLATQIEARDQRTLQLKAFPSAASKGQVLVEEQGQPWLNLNRDCYFLKSGEILWASERTGFKHLYLLDAQGQPVRTLTTGEWMVVNVVKVDEPRRLVYFRATKDSILERHLYSVGLDGGEICRLTPEVGWHDITFSHDGEYFIDSFSSLEHAPTVTLRRSNGEAVVTLFENPGTTATELSLQPPQLFSFQNRASVELHGAVYLPPQMDKSKQYPLIVSVYGGPHAQRVMDEWSLTVDLRAQYLAEQGFVVLKVDNRGSANRGLAFEGTIAGDLGHFEVEDQVDGVEYLIGQGYIDSARVGVFGWSYGGYMTLMCLLRAPQVFKMGVAGAPVTDWYGYDTHYTERYLGLPSENSAGYEQSSVLTHVANLQGKLLLVHGLIDENVHFRHTARLIEALIAAQKTYDLLLFPSERHMPRNPKALEYMERRISEYFQTNL